MIQRLLAVLFAAFLATAAWAGEVTLKGSDRLLFDVDGNHISAYALKIYCKVEPPTHTCLEKVIADVNWQIQSSVWSLKGYMEENAKAQLTTVNSP